MSTRGFAIIAKGKAIEDLAYFSSDAYMSWYGLQFLHAVKDGEGREFLAKIREQNGGYYGYETTPSEWKMEHFCYHKPKPDEEEDGYPEYSYIYDEKTNTMTVRHYGRVLFRFSLADEYPLFAHIFENDFDIRTALDINLETKFDSRDGWAELKHLIKNGASIQDLKEVVANAPKVYINKGAYQTYNPWAHPNDLPTWGYTLYASHANIQFDGEKFIEEPDSEALYSLCGVNLEPFTRGEPRLGYKMVFKFLHVNVATSSLTPIQARAKNKGISRTCAERCLTDFATRNMDELVAVSKAQQVYYHAEDILKKNDTFVPGDEEVFQAARDSISAYLDGKPVRGIPYLTANDMIRRLQQELDLKIKRKRAVRE